MKFVKSDALRRQLFEAFKTRAYPKNREVLKQMMQTRYEIATLLGYAELGGLLRRRQDGGTRAADRGVHPGSGRAARALADREFAMLLAEKKKTDPAATASGRLRSGASQRIAAPVEVRFRFAISAAVPALRAA